MSPLLPTHAQHVSNTFLQCTAVASAALALGLLVFFTSASSDVLSSHLFSRAIKPSPWAHDVTVGPQASTGLSATSPGRLQAAPAVVPKDSPGTHRVRLPAPRRHMAVDDAGGKAASTFAHRPSVPARVAVWLLPIAAALLALVRIRFRAAAQSAGPERQSFHAVTVTGRPVPERMAPQHGSSPPWMDRGPGRCPDPVQFMRSDPAKPDVGELPECPLTRAVPAEGAIEQLQQEAHAAVAAAGSFPLEIRATAQADAEGATYFRTNRERILQSLQDHGCIWFRGFSLMQDVAGYREFWEALGLSPCLDPIHSSGLRKFASKRDGLYEEVNKPALRRHYIGLHQESSSKRTAAAAAFVCFQRATGAGGRFFVADGAAILAELDPATVARLAAAGVRISVSNIDTPLGSAEGLSGLARDALKGAVEALVAPRFDMDLEMVWGADGTPGRLQAIETRAAPVVRHPKTRVPVWFCNAHNHLRYLRDRRPCTVPEVGMTDVYLGDALGRVSPEDCEEVARACEKHIVALPMEAGDVVLVDNYRALHGRDVFEGDRYHAVAWFTWDDPAWREGAGHGSSKDVANQMINQYMDLLPRH